MKIYIAGPMRGKKNFGFDRFDLFRDILAHLGHEVVSPADLDREEEDWGKYPPDDFVATPALRRKFMLRDLKAIADGCDALFMLDGASQSSGAKAEMAFGAYLGLDFFEEGRFCMRCDNVDCKPLACGSCAAPFVVTQDA